ncbi:MAG: oligosaccharide flippase family protein [Nitrospirae bacterium]|nr:oligosaccharide flippase family protein [Nitrospirota bacterium]
MRDKIKKGFLNLSLRQIAGLVISATGSILLARLLGLEVFGLYAISSFFVTFLGNYAILGVNRFLIGKHGELSDDYIRTSFTIVFFNGLAFLVIMFFAAAPLLSHWYGKEELYWLISLSSIGVFISSILRISQSLMEREMEYGKVGIVEVSGIIAFYVPSVISAFSGLGIFAIVIGEICRGLSSLLGFKFRPFSLRLLWEKDLFKEIIKFVFSYNLALLPWNINGALNPVVVARIAGIEAAGIIRIADGIVSQLSFFIGITDRMSYPVFSRFQNEREKILKAVEEGRIYQFLLACFPLFIFSAFSFRLIPLLYGQEWYPVTNVLILMCLTFGVNTIFGLYSSSLITVGRNSDIAKFTITNSLALWLISPVTVYYFGYLGLPIAAIITSPSYYIMHRFFMKSYGKPKYTDITTLLIITYTITIAAWSAKNIYLSLIIFMILNAIYLVCSRGLRQNIKDMISLIKIRPQEMQPP